MKKFYALAVCISIISNLMIAQSWQQTQGPGGGNVVDIIKRNGVVLAATFNGVYRSTDNGNNWVRSSAGIGNGVVITTFAATSKFIYGGSYDDGLYKSADNGVTWKPVKLSVLNIFISALYASHDTLYAGCDGCGVYRSVNEAASFQTVNNGFPGNAHISSVIELGSYLFTGLAGNGGTVGVYRTNVSVINWTQVNTGLGDAPSVIDLAVKGNDLLMTGQTFNSAGLYRTPDYGNHWTKIPLALPGGEYPTLLAVTGNDIFFGTNGDAPYKSSDNAATFQRVDKGLKPLSVFCFFADASVVFMGYERGVARTTNEAASWQRKVSGLTNTSVTSLYTAGDTLFATARSTNIGSSDGVFFTVNNGQNWLSLDKGLLPDPQASSLVKAGSNIVLGTTNFGLYIKKPSQDAFTRAKGLDNTLRVNALISSSKYVLAGVSGDGELYRSTDYGLTWAKSNTGFNTSQEDQVFTFYQKGSVIYAGGFNALYKTTDFGAHWTSSNNGIYPGSEVKGITGSGNDLYAVTSGSGNIYKSTNNGASWFKVNNGIPAIIHLNTITNVNGILYAGSDSGVYKSENNGASWSLINTGLLPQHNAVCFAVQNNKLFLGTDATAVWQTPLSINKTDAVEAKSLTVPTFSINVFPNPSKGYLRIIMKGYTGAAVFTITNSVGETVYAKSENINNNEVAVDITNQPKGIYLISIKTSGNTITKKVVLE